MTTALKCPECGQSKTQFRLHQKQRPELERAAMIAFGLVLLIGPPIAPALTYSAATPYQFDLSGLGAMLIGGLLLWGSYNKSEEFNLNRTITSIDFRCDACNHEWDLKVKESKWGELPLGHWQRVVPGRRIPGLEG